MYFTHTSKTTLLKNTVFILQNLPFQQSPGVPEEEPPPPKERCLRFYRRAWPSNPCTRRPLFVHVCNPNVPA